ncbi:MULTISPECIES: reverse transcriptase domain-containing protein [Planktothricoides]|uniref:RNA-dependent DNA polymerase n=1 Tax=Planktothricoides raciborskii FACHB-1370 TaxID=2949576 RepID=A0ABR8EHH7_9CYAN|nr:MULTISPECIES: reverse transcriptase domain-containing protein [Planktothricoides]KOR35584.1 DNA polymerase [Planktothricoides sp. SR001]MBD2545902.1 RNA-dependent DNA polymerase [Planktothricoides raciborskii FACHB-1370]MBD2582263.1 RNA-dependent DNA polymerase [Planktothricoides raciborskii FACHB-1261]
MKSFNNLWPNVTNFDNLLQAARQAQKNKRFRENVLKFNDNLETNLIQLQQELQTKTYQPSKYKAFHIFEPKKRLISAAPYRDRVIHHALCNIIVPIFEPTFIPDSYSNRVGFGTHRAVKRFTQFFRSSRYILQCDIRKYFPTIDREILKSLIRRKIKCHDTLWLIDLIIDNGNDQEPIVHYFPGDDLLTPLMRPCGLPIGNLTSQFFANIYLNGFDRYLKEQLKVRKYLRYVDDFALFSDDRHFLMDARVAIEEYLATLRLKIHPIKSQLFETRHGANFLGFRIMPDRIRICSKSLKRGRRKLKYRLEQYRQGEIDRPTLKSSVASWQAHLNHGDTWRLQQKLFAPLDDLP